MPGDSHRLLRNDKIVTDDQNMPDVVSVEYLNEVDVPGTSPHKLHLKLGSLISFIGNIIRGISRHVLDIEVIADGLRLVKVPRTSFEVQVGGRDITFHRMQFPVRCCYAMTINKSQGQTLKHVGLDLRGDVFCHGQRYVAVSRTTSRNNIICLVRPERLLDGIPHVHNVVYVPRIYPSSHRAPTFFQ